MKNQEMIKKGKGGAGGIMMFGMLLLFLLLSAAPCSLLPSSYAAPLTDESPLQFVNNEAVQTKDAGPTFFASIVKLFSGLAVVIGVLLVIYYFVRERLGNINRLAGKGRMINVLATHYLAPKKAVMVIEVAGECLVVGVGEEINLLTRIGNIDQESGNREHGPGFSDVLQAASAGEGSLGVIDSIKERLENLKGKR